MYENIKNDIAITVAVFTFLAMVIWFPKKIRGFGPLIPIFLKTPKFHVEYL